MAKSSKSRGSVKTTPKDNADVPSYARVHIWHVQAFRDVLLVAAVIALFWIGYLLRAVTVPLLLALMLAYLFEPLVARWSKNPRLTRARVLILLICTFGVIVGLTVSLAVTLAVGQGVRVVDDIQSGAFREKLERVELPEIAREPFDGLLKLLPAPAQSARIPLTLETSTDNAAGGTVDDGGTTVLRGESGDAAQRELELLIDERITAALGQRNVDAAQAGTAEDGNWLSFARGSADAVLRILGTLLSIGFLTFLIPFYFFFFSLWYPDVMRFGRGLIPEKNKSRTIELLGKMNEAVSGFVRGRIVISFIMGGMLAIGWSICGVPYAVVLGLAIGVFCAVPYLGGIGVPLAVGLLWFDSIGPEGGLTTDLWQILTWPTVVFVIVQAVEGWILTPVIAGKATDLDPVTILVAVLAGGSVLGVYGMLLAIPAAACGKILLAEVLMPKIRDWAAGRAADPLPITRD